MYPPSEGEVLFRGKRISGKKPYRIGRLGISRTFQAVELIRRVREDGKTILVIEHVMRAIKSVCDRIFVLHHGEKIADGPVNELLDDETVIQAYLGKRYRDLTRQGN